MFEVRYSSCQWFDDSDEVKYTDQKEVFDNQEDAIDAYVSASEDYENCWVRIIEV